MPSTLPKLILASTSPYRATLLRRLGLTFEICDPQLTETITAGETASARAQRLARSKAAAVAARFPAALVVGCDQVASSGNRLLEKPGNLATAKQHLTAVSGKRADFFTAVCLINTVTGTTQSALVPYAVYFRALSVVEIEAYLLAEQPLDCAGAIKSEGLGSSLFERLKVMIQRR